VLAHEIAHIASRHAATQLTTIAMTKWSLNFLGSLLGNAGGAGGAQVAAAFLANGMALQFSRDEEREADRVGLALMSRAGWDGRGMVEMFEILRKASGRDPSAVGAFFSTHPSPQARIKELSAVVASHRTGRRDSREFQVMKSRLRKLPRGSG
jgi:predicted Zn-dependent protease